MVIYHWTNGSGPGKSAAAIKWASQLAARGLLYTPSQTG